MRRWLALSVRVTVAVLGSLLFSQAVAATPSLHPVKDEFELAINALASWEPSPDRLDATGSPSFSLCVRPVPVPGYPDYQVAPAMKRLVRGGIKSLPALLRHLDDDWTTHVYIRSPTHGGAAWFGGEFDPRDRLPGFRQVLPVPATCPQYVPGGRYYLRVGDLCFAAVGQIVNRNLDPVRYQPTACIALNSPVRCPALAAAVRKDWAGLTREQHLASLRYDAAEANYWLPTQALQRLRFYYPKEGAAMTAALLRRPEYDLRELTEFVETRLTPELDETRWQPALDDLERTHGATARRAVPQVLWQLYLDRDRDPPKPEVGERALVLLRRLYPAYLTRQRPFVNAVPKQYQRYLIGNLAYTLGIPSP